MSNEKIKKALIELADEYKIPYNSEAQGIYLGFIYAVGDADSYETLIKQALEEKAISRVQFGRAMDVALDIAVTLEDFSILLVLMDGNSAEDYYHARKIALRKAAEIGCLWIVEHLVMHGADVSGNHAALIGAVEYGKKDVVKFFVSYGADIYTRWRDTDMMVHYIQCQDMDMIQFLFDQGYDIYNEDVTEHYSSLSVAASKGELEIFKYLFEETGKNDEKCLGMKLFCAVCHGQLNIVKYIMNTITSLTPNNWNYIKSAVGKLLFLNNKDIEKIKYLVECGLDISSTKISIEKVIKYGNPETVKYLVKHGANTDIKETEYENILNYFIYHEDMDMVRYLLKQGIVGNIQEKERFSQLAETDQYTMLKYLATYANPKDKFFFANIFETAVKRMDLNVILALTSQEMIDAVPGMKEGLARAIETATEEGDIYFLKQMISMGANEYIQVDGISPGEILCAFAVRSKLKKDILIRCLKEENLVDHEAMMENAFNFYMDALYEKTLRINHEKQKEYLEETQFLNDRKIKRRRV